MTQDGACLKLRITIDDKTYEVEVEAEDTVEQTSAIPFAPALMHVCRSPVAGVTVSVNVQEDKQVQINDPSPMSAKVKTIRGRAGESVQANQVGVDFI